MARIERRQQVTTPFSPAEAHSRLLAVFAARSATMAMLRENYLEGRTGSQAAIRLKGGWLAKTEEFPVVAAVDVTPAGSGSLVRLTVADDLGFGVKTGINKKYTKAVEGFAADLAASLAAAPGMQQRCPAGHTQPGGARFCSTCGAPVACE